MNSRTLHVDLPGRSYPIHIGNGILADRLGSLLSGRSVCIVTDNVVSPLYLERVESTLALSGRPSCTITLPSGEEHKTLATVGSIFDAMLDAGLGRDCVLVALGGGVVGDMAGFAAACFQRGIEFLQAPTTLLAQVDSAVGGKTAVNHPRGKNLIGAFHQPSAVVIDTDTLSTLEPRQFRAGIAEIVKYGLVADPRFFDWLEEHMAQLIGQDPATLQAAIHRSCSIKAQIVSEDEREHGRRAILNLGHTFGHAIEAGLGFGTWLHGEAVAAGTVLAARLSVHIGWLEMAALTRIERLLEQADLPIEAPGLPAERMVELMQRDKKVRDGRVHLVLLRGIGEPAVTANYAAKDLAAILGT